MPVSTEVRAALCGGGTNRFRDVYETMLAYEHADWITLSDTVARFQSIESQVPACYLAAANRASELAP